LWVFCPTAPPNKACQCFCTTAPLNKMCGFCIQQHP
jgi:hypothetical protein